MATLLFDSQGTLVDNYTIADVLEPHVTGARTAHAIAYDWRQRQKWYMCYTTCADYNIPMPELDRRFIRAAKSQGASEWCVLRRIVLPGTMPHIFTGLSVAVGITWLMVIAAEMVASRGGLGYLTWEAYATFNYPMIFVGMTAIGILGALSSALLRCVNRRVMPWRKRF